MREQHIKIRDLLIVVMLLSLLLFLAMNVSAHKIGSGDQAFVEQSQGVQVLPYIYLGAKHMVTGYDHLLYLAGVIFFLFKIRDVAVFVSLFALGHSITLLWGVLAGWHVNPHLVDSIIGLSVVYKAFENLGGFRIYFKSWLDTRVAVFLFGLVHGLGLATKLQDLNISQEGLITNMISFNVGVELGQLVALTFLIMVFSLLRSSRHFQRNSIVANTLIMMAGFVLIGDQLTGYFLMQG
jgi:hypothetical protein